MSARTAGAAFMVTVRAKTGEASTLDVVAGVKRTAAAISTTLPPQILKMHAALRPVGLRPRRDQGVIREAVIAAALTGLMILLFLGSWRSTLIIAVSIPLSILPRSSCSACWARPSTS
ncbi:MAG: efflux RND transporter permease subunit [Paludibaculum sp.]